MDFQFSQYGFNFNPKTVRSSEVKQRREKEEANLQKTLDALYTASNNIDNNKRRWIG